MQNLGDQRFDFVKSALLHRSDGTLLWINTEGTRCILIGNQFRYASDVMNVADLSSLLTKLGPEQTLWPENVRNSPVRNAKKTVGYLTPLSKSD